MRGFFSLEGARQALGSNQTIERCLEQARQSYQEQDPPRSLRVTDTAMESLWSKLDQLLYLPLLGLTRPRDLYYYQGQGLRVLLGFNYKYLTLEHFLAELSRLQLGYPLADALADCYSQAWYPGEAPLFIFTDWHGKPHWTKEPSHCGHIAMWQRVMPGTKQLIINGPQGHLLGGWNYPVDSHLANLLVDLEADLATKLQRPIAYTIVDGEGSGAPLAQRYSQAQRAYLSILPRRGEQNLATFELLGSWKAVVDDPLYEAVEARWRDPAKAQAELRRLVLVRPVEQPTWPREQVKNEPTRIYAGCIPASLSASEVPTQFRQRWMCQERVIRELVNGANLNANYGYSYREVPNRTQQRRWQKAQARVEVTERKLGVQQELSLNLCRRIAADRQRYQQQRQQLQEELVIKKGELVRRQAAGQPDQRCQQAVQKRHEQLRQQQQRFSRQQQRCWQKLRQSWTRRSELSQELRQRRAERDQLDHPSLCRERNLEKDQIMLDLQILLASLHDWTRTHFLAPEWRRLELNTATELIYRKPGRVRWGKDEIEVLLEPYRYPEHQRAMQETCRRFNAAQLHWRDGRRLYIHVASSSNSQLCGFQGAGKT